MNELRASRRSDAIENSIISRFIPPNDVGVRVNSSTKREQTENPTGGSSRGSETNDKKKNRVTRIICNLTVYFGLEAFSSGIIIRTTNRMIRKGNRLDVTWRSTIPWFN